MHKFPVLCISSRSYASGNPINPPAFIGKPDNAARTRGDTSEPRNLVATDPPTKTRTDHLAPEDACRVAYLCIRLMHRVCILVAELLAVHFAAPTIRTHRVGPCLVVRVAVARIAGHGGRADRRGPYRQPPNCDRRPSHQMPAT
jgi:hypothetical protein